MAASVVETRGLVRRFGPAAVLTGLDLRAQAGEVVAIFGPNGAGKTTLMRILAMLLTPTSGSVRLFGEDAFGSSAAMLRRRLGMVTHESFLYADLTPAENLLFYARLYGVEDGATRVDELVAWAGLDAHRSRPVRAFSRGMTQRLALARALLHAPELLVLDEPFSGLDAVATAAVEDVLEQGRRAGRTVLLTTHDVARGLGIADRVYILHRGRVAWESTGTTEPAAFSDAYRRAVGDA